MSAGAARADPARQWAAACLCLSRVLAPEPERVSLIEPRAAALAQETGSLPPLGLLLDVPALVLGAALPLDRVGAELEAGLGRALESYADRFLGRLAREPLLEAAGDALARLPTGLRDRGHAVLLARLLARVGFDQGLASSPAALARLFASAPEELLEEGYALLHANAAPTHALARAYAALVAGARQVPALLSEADVFLLEHLAALERLPERVAFAQIAEAADALEAQLPRRLKGHRAERGAHLTPLSDEAQYPTGGFASIATAGTLENLVASELIYMDDRVPQGEVDLFDVRYVEGELLYYTRDESLYARDRRRLTLVMLPELRRMRVQEPGARWQRLSLALAAVLVAVRRLSAWLTETELSIQLLYAPDASGAQPLAAERGLTQVMLAEWIERGVVELGVCSDLASLAEGSVWVGTTAEAPPGQWALDVRRPYLEWPAMLQAILQRVVDG